MLLWHGHPRPRPERPASDAPTFSLAEILQGLRAKQFEPFFQPQVQLVTGAIIGAEALARWRHPEKGLVGVNLSLVSLADTALADRITEVVRNAGLEPRHMVLVE